MIRFALTIGMAALSSVAVAQSRPSTTAMTCSQASAYLASQGAAVMGTGGFTYDRFVTSRAYCEPTQTTRTAFVATADDRACAIGFTCIEPTLELGRD